MHTSRRGQRLPSPGDTLQTNAGSTSRYGVQFVKSDLPYASLENVTGSEIFTTRFLRCQDLICQLLYCVAESGCEPNDVRFCQLVERPCENRATAARAILPGTSEAIAATSTRPPFSMACEVAAKRLEPDLAGDLLCRRSSHLELKLTERRSSPDDPVGQTSAS